ncbi:Fip1l1 [Symbiodinium pilosum]|uniref:Fip1l1 protein n=1 Tax=Symbiodinium pilosum TaxID=2952 RepID=A0A812TJ92_SYMPI|nr:Fip1l1 [Symbiodinium pilosum]
MAKVEVRPAPGQKRPRDDDEVEVIEAAPVDLNFEAPDASDEEDNVRVVLCESGPRSGGMAYYLGRQWERGAVHGEGTLDGEPDAAQAAALAVVAPDNQAELVEQDEDLESTMAKISFQMDEAELADTPWRRAGTNLSDYFNFGMSEDEFKAYVMRRGVRVRLEAKGRRKIERLEGGRRQN